MFRRLIYIVILIVIVIAAPRVYRKIDFAMRAMVKFPVIDAHTHTDFDGQNEQTSQILVSKDQYLKELKDAGIVASVSHLSRDGGGYDEDLAKNHHVIFCFGVSEKTTVNQVKMALDEGKVNCLKIYLGYVHKFANDPHYKQFYPLAEKYNVPVVFHTGDTYSVKGKLKYADPLTVDEVAVDFPKVNFVIAHLGNPWIQSAAEVSYKNPNVYLEGSALLIGSLKETGEGAIERFMREPLKWAYGYSEDSKKLIFGTDWPLVSIKDYLQIYKEAIPKDAWCDVFFNNAVRVFHLEEQVKNQKCEI